MNLTFEKGREPFGYASILESGVRMTRFPLRERAGLGQQFLEQGHGSTSPGCQKNNSQKFGVKILNK